MTAQNKFRTYLQTSAEEIEEELKKISVEWNSYQKNTFSEIGELEKRFSDSWFGGKMLRGTLVKLGYELVSNQSINAILKPASAIEILHTALLIHDDIIDKSPTRRGKQAFHMHKNAHYGVSQAICLGDIGISLAGQIIAESDFPTERKNRALQYFLKMVHKTITGEMMDVASAYTNNRTDEQILQIHTLKTANYTIIGPLILGAILADASVEYLKKLESFGEPLGIAYQIQDDILGIFGNEKKLGKSTTSDIEENKSTLLITHALKRADKGQLKLLHSYYGKKGITSKQQEQIKQIIVQTGALTYSQNIVIKLTSQAKEIIPQLSQRKSKQDLLMQFIDHIIAREK